jgi:hypothetical protein
MRGSSASSRVDSERSGSESPRHHKSARRDSDGNKENNDPTMNRKLAIAPIESVRRLPQGRCSGDIPVSMPLHLRSVTAEG